MLASPPLLPVTNNDNTNNRTFTKLLVQNSDVAQVANIVQLFHKRYIDFRLGETELVVEASTTSTTTTATGGECFQQNKIEPYHLISYHTVEKKKILEEDDNENNDDPYSSTLMGVWNCQISLSLTEKKPWNTTLIERVLLDQVNTSNASNTRRNHLAILLTLDLNEPSTVAPIVNSIVPLLQKVYQLFDDDLPSFGDPPPIKEQHNVELKDERDLQPFHEKKISADESNAKNNVLFFFTCILPIHDPSTFKEKQIQALLTYHLHRYAFLTNSSLVFVCPSAAATYREHESSSTAAAAGKALSSNGMDIITFTKIIYRLATSATLVEEDEGDTATMEEGIGDLLHKNYMFTPKDHDETMIETILRRNANCEGLWDVEKDSLPNILPLQQLPTTTRSRPQQQPNTATTDYNDDFWLSKLASSTIRFTEAPSTTSATTTSTAAVELPKSSRPSIPQEKKKPTTTDTTSIDPTSFFESLLKKS